jgi:malonyl-CoA O-methyltransferase
MARIERRGMPEARATFARARGHRQRAARATRPWLREAFDAALAHGLRRPRTAYRALRGQGAFGSLDEALEHGGSIYSRAPMADPKPPTIDPPAAARWEHAAPARSPWLHEEVGRRMAVRLEWIRLDPKAWADWEPVRGGMEAHRIVAARYPRAEQWIAEHDARRADSARKAFANPWWRFNAAAIHHGDAPEAGVQMLWANMALHMAADPQALVAKWHRALATDGFLMFSCLGPDTLRELRELYAALGWPPPAHEFTDMHDWGDMLVHSGFAEPVMDMERITLTWPTAERMLAELRELGANLNRARFAALRGRSWRRRLGEEAERGLRAGDGRLALTFEIVYGHALKPPPRVRVADESAISVRDMQSMLRSGRKPG